MSVDEIAHVTASVNRIGGGVLLFFVLGVCTGLLAYVVRKRRRGK